MGLPCSGWLSAESGPNVKEENQAIGHGMTFTKSMMARRLLRRSISNCQHLRSSISRHQGRNQSSHINTQIPSGGPDTDIRLVCDLYVLVASVEATRGDDGRPHAWHHTEAPLVVEWRRKKIKHNALLSNPVRIQRSSLVGSISTLWYNDNIVKRCPDSRPNEGGRRRGGGACAPTGEKGMKPA